MDTPFQKSQSETCPAESAAPDAQHGGDDSAGNSSPPYSNTGGKKWEYEDPESGERFFLIPIASSSTEFKCVPIPSKDGVPMGAITDYLSFSFPFDFIESSLSSVSADIETALGKKFLPLMNCGRGLNGYKYSFDLGESTARFAYGGQRDTAWITLPGKACALVDNWKPVIDLFSEKRRARITRWDGAVDSYDGTFSIATALDILKQGLFNAGGRAPVLNQRGNWIEPDGRGRTLYLGRRENGKVLRIYEKGMQLGHQWHPWVRWELEVHNTDRVIPWDVLLKPGEYFVGGYPKALKWANFPASRIKTIQKAQTISYVELTKHASTAYGPLLNVMLEVEGSAQAVVDLLVRSGSPKRLQHPITDNGGDYIDPSSEESC